jgi:hypothetical protein
MYKLVLSPRRYSAILHASHVLDGKTEIITIGNGMEENSPYKFCLEAMNIQRKFELEKAFKEFGVRKLYTMNQSMYHINYELVTIKLQLLLTVNPFTHFYFMNNGDQRLYQICQAINCGAKKLVYKPKGKVSWKHKLTEEELERKLNAIERMVTVRKELLYHDLVEEYVQR